MKYESSSFQYEENNTWQTPAAGVKRQIMGYDDRILLAKVLFVSGSDGGGQHRHPHSQSSLIVSGVFEVTVDGITTTLRAGDGFYAAPDQLHGVVCLESGTIVDAFSPVREEFLKG
ncbi:MAG: cupin domain-containing protein [Rikenellaceae bacterium]|nr:cupin domain-containing protein [Rikenellaceae bacterium]